MTTTPDDKWAEDMADRILSLFEMRAQTLKDIRDMGAETKRIEGLRVEWIRRARELGVPAWEVAEAAGISRQQVYRITKNGSK